MALGFGDRRTVELLLQLTGRDDVAGATRRAANDLRGLSEQTKALNAQQKAAQDLEKARIALREQSIAQEARLNSMEAYRKTGKLDPQSNPDRYVSELAKAEQALKRYNLTQEDAARFAQMQGDSIDEYIRKLRTGEQSIAGYGQNSRIIGDVLHRARAAQDGFNLSVDKGAASLRDAESHVRTTGEAVAKASVEVDRSSHVIGRWGKALEDAGAKASRMGVGAFRWGQIIGAPLQAIGAALGAGAGLDRSLSGVIPIVGNLVGVLSTLGVVVGAIPAVLALAAGAVTFFGDALGGLLAVALGLVAPLTLLAGFTLGPLAAVAFTISDVVKSQATSAKNLTALHTAQATYNRDLARYGAGAATTADALVRLHTAQQTYNKGLPPISTNIGALKTQLDAVGTSIERRVAPFVGLLFGLFHNNLSYLQRIINLPLPQFFRSLATEGVNRLYTSLEQLGHAVAPLIRDAIAAAFNYSGNLHTKLVMLWNQLQNFFTGQHGALIPAIKWFDRQHFMDEGISLFHTFAGFLDRSGVLHNIGSALVAALSDALRTTVSLFGRLMIDEIRSVFSNIPGLITGTAHVASGQSPLGYLGPLLLGGAAAKFALGRLSAGALAGADVAGATGGSIPALAGAGAAGAGVGAAGGGAAVIGTGAALGTISLLAIPIIEGILTRNTPSIISQLSTRTLFNRLTAGGTTGTSSVAAEAGMFARAGGPQVVNPQYQAEFNKRMASSANDAVNSAIRLNQVVANFDSTSLDRGSKYAKDLSKNLTVAALNMLHVQGNARGFIENISRGLGQPLALQQITGLLHSVPEQVRGSVAAITEAMHRLPTTKLIHFLVDHQAATRSITAFLLTFHRLPSAKQLRILMNSSQVDSQIAAFIDKYHKLPTEKQIKVMIHAQDAQRQAQEISQKIGQIRERTVSIKANNSDAIRKADQTRAKMNSLKNLTRTLTYHFNPSDPAGKGSEVGVLLGNGIAAGIGSTDPAIKAAAQAAVQTAYTAARTAIKPGSPSRLFAQGIGVPIVEGITSGMIKAAGGAQAALKSILSTLLQTFQGFQQQFQGQFGDLFTGPLGGGVNQRTGFQTPLAMQLGMPGQHVTFSAIRSDLRSQIAAIQRWNHSMAIARREFPPGLLAQLEALGPAAQPEVDALINASRSNRGQYIRLFRAEQTGLLNASQSSMAVQMRQWSSMGRTFAFGILAGLREGTPALRREMLGIVRGLFIDVQKYNKSHSPSRLYAEEGHNMINGLVAGLREAGIRQGIHPMLVRSATKQSVVIYKTDVRQEVTANSGESMDRTMRRAKHHYESTIPRAPSA